MKSKEFREGSRAYYGNPTEASEKDNPYPIDTPENWEWHDGFIDAFFEQDRFKLEHGERWNRIVRGEYMKSSIILIRHGESLGNVASEYYEVHDTANILSEKGVQQALALKAQIGSIMNPDKFGTHTTVISSKHQRAKLTAEIVMQGSYHHPILHDARLNECFHESETGPGGDFVNTESRESVVRRVRHLVQQHEFDLVLFCHGVLMHMLEDRGQEVGNCEVRKYDREDFIQRILA